MNPTAGSCHGEVDQDCWLPLREVLKGLMKAVLSLQELTSCLSGWERDVSLLRGQERKYRQPREREKRCWHSQQGAFFFKKKTNCMRLFWLRWLFVASLALSSCGEQGLLFVVVCRLLTAAASHCRARALGHRGFSSCSSQVQELRFGSCGTQA